MRLDELFFGGTPKQKERSKRVVPAPPPNPAKLAAEFRKIRGKADENYVARVWRDLVGAVGEEKAKALVASQDSVKKTADRDVWKGRHQ